MFHVFFVKCKTCPGESYVTVTGIINVSYFHATLTKARHKIKFSETKARQTIRSPYLNPVNNKLTPNLVANRFWHKCNAISPLILQGRL